MAYIDGHARQVGVMVDAVFSYAEPASRQRCAGDYRTVIPAGG
jgi:hypothetical protein